MLEIQLRATTGRQGHAPGAHEAARAVQRGASCATRAPRSAGGSRRTPRTTRPRRSAPRSSGSPPRRRAGTSSSTRTPRRCRSSATREDALPLMLVMARVIEKEQGDVDRALDMNRQILELDERNEQALDALERLYLGKGQLRGAARASTRRSSSSRTIPTSAIAIQSKIGQLYEDEVKDDKKAVAAYMAILDATGDEPSALSSLDRIYLRNQQWKELGGRPRPADHDHRSRGEQGRARRAEVPARPAQGTAPRRRRRCDRCLPRHPRHRRRPPEGARLARESISRG